MRFFEVVNPLRTKLADLTFKRGSLTEELDVHRNQTKTLMEVPRTYSGSCCSSVSFSSLLYKVYSSRHIDVMMMQQAEGRFRKNKSAWLLLI